MRKAVLYMRALRRSILAYWFATVEGMEAATIEAINATLLVNILDEAVFESGLGDAYRSRRTNDTLGRVVAGLELIRNCETHTHVYYPDLIVNRATISVPVGGVRACRRVVPAWAAFGNLPAEYVKISGSGTPNQKRARPESLDAYRKAVQTRDVIETLLDAAQFFQTLDPRLQAPDPLPAAELGVVEVSSADPPTRRWLTRPLGFDSWNLWLPDLACRNTERRAAAWEPADRALKRAAEEARNGLPAATSREIIYAIRDRKGDLIGYSGYSGEQGSRRSSWVERHERVWHDVRRGYPYFIVRGGQKNRVTTPAHELLVALDEYGVDLLRDLPRAQDPSLDDSRLELVETYDDLYVQMRLEQ